VEKECCLPGVFCDSGDTPANLLCELSGLLMLCTSCLYGIKWVEDVCVLANLAYLSILFCAVLLAAAPGLVAVLPMWDSAHVSGILSRPRPLAFLLFYSFIIIIIVIIIIYTPRSKDLRG